MIQMHMINKAVAQYRWKIPALMMILCLSACGTSQKAVGNLEAIDSQASNKVSIKSVWSLALGKPNYIPHFQPRQGLLAVSSADGLVKVINEKGDAIWSVNIQAPIAAGVGFDGERGAVIANNDELVVLNKSGVLWRKPLRGRTATAPFMAGERVFVLGLDRAVDAFDAVDGRYLWRYQRSGDPLALQSIGVIGAYRNTLLVGHGSRLLGLNSVTGTLQWDVAVAIPKGLDEIERLSELVGGLVKVSDTAYCVRAYQSAIGCVDVDKSSLRWSRKLLGTDALAGNSEILVATDAVDRLNGWNSQTGQLLWSNESFVRRGLSAPAIWDDMVVVGDAEGTLHFLVSATGKTIFRESTGSSAIESAPLVFGKTLLVVNSKGDLLAFRANNK